MKRCLLAFLAILLWSNAAIAALAVDATPSASGGAAVSLTTTQSNELIVLYIVTGSGGATCDATSVSDTAGLTWHTRIASTLSGTLTIGNVYAISSGALTSDSITVAGTCTNARTQAIAISGVDTTTPFDTNGSIPAMNSSASSPNALTASTNNANDMLIGFIRGSGGLGTITRPSGFTFIGNAGSTAQESSYDIVSTTQSSVTFTYSYVAAASSIFYLDAVRQAPSSTPSIKVPNIPYFFGGFPR